MSQNLPSLTALRCVEATVRTGSMSAAADELHLTHGAVSRQVRNAERLIGTALFERRNRAVVPTAAGRRFAEDARDLLAHLANAVQAARHRGPTAGVVLSCEPTLLMRWLIPRLASFRDREPGITVQLVAGGGPVDFRRDGIDLAVRRNDFPRDPRTVTVPLMAERTGPVCRPEVAARLNEPADLAEHTLLHTRTRPDAWSAWLARAGVTLDGPRREVYEHFYIALEAAGAGLGVAIGPIALVRDAVASGQLAAPFGFQADGTRYELLSPTPIEPGGPRHALLQWLRDTIDAESSLGD